MIFAVGLIRADEVTSQKGISMKNFMIVALIGALLGVGGCSIISRLSAPEEQTAGAMIRDEQMIGLKDRHSTTLAVFNRLGQPSRKLMSINGSEQWFYDFARTFRTHPQDNISESIVFDFGRDGIMTSHRRMVLMTH